jgi:hypothetical protein
VTGKKNKTVSLSDLPIELLNMIFDELEFIEDVLSLSMASLFFWEIGQRWYSQWWWFGGGYHLPLNTDK